MPVHQDRQLDVRPDAPRALCRTDPADTATTDTLHPLPAYRHRRCAFQLALSCGHLVTVRVTGWYPVSVSCCDRLGGTVLRGVYVPYASDVELVGLLSERYETQPVDSGHEAVELLSRCSRTDEPYQPPYPGRQHASAGRYPARVGAFVDLDRPSSPVGSA